MTFARDVALAGGASWWWSSAGARASCVAARAERTALEQAVALAPADTERLLLDRLGAAYAASSDADVGADSSADEVDAFLVEAFEPT